MKARRSFPRSKLCALSDGLRPAKRDLTTPLSRDCEIFHFLKTA